jgi:hypothetical protein
MGIYYKITNMMKWYKEYSQSYKYDKNNIHKYDKRYKNDKKDNLSFH